MTGHAKPLSALLSQILVALTIEVDDAFEQRMQAAGIPNGHLSLVVWSNLMRFVPPGGVAVGEISSLALTPADAVKSTIGCLERWGFLHVEANPAGPALKVKMHRLAGRTLRDGWGSGRGIRNDCVVRPTERGWKALHVWPSLPDEIERRWQVRFGEGAIQKLRASLEAITGRLEVELPQGLPGGFDIQESYDYPPRAGGHVQRLSLAALLSQTLLAFATEFDRESSVPLSLAANVVRVIDSKGVRVSDLARLTGVAPERCALGWQVKVSRCIETGADPTGKRGQIVSLTARGLEVQRTYPRIASEIERRWATRFGAEPVSSLRASLQGLLDGRDGERPRLAEGLVPPAGVARSGHQTPALGRRHLGTAARQRGRDVVAQTALFVADPAGSLPHFPLWDFNRGFGP